MTRYATVWMVVVISFCISCQQSVRHDDELLIIENITVIDPVDGVKEAQSILIKEDRIIEVVPSDEVTYTSTNTIDGAGKFLIPGLWDAHVHFAFIEELAATMPDLFLAYGITSVRDTGGKISFVKPIQTEALANPSSFPRVMIAGPLLDGSPNVYDGSSLDYPPLSSGHQEIDDLTATVEQLDSIGVDLLKAYEMLSKEQFMHLSSLAKDKNLPLTGHVPLSMDVISVSNAGLGGIEHLRNVELSCATNAGRVVAR